MADAVMPTMEGKEMSQRKKCKCGAERMLIKPAWYNNFRVPTWVCIAKYD